VSHFMRSEPFDDKDDCEVASTEKTEDVDDEAEDERDD
jgi:hypothetical protein